MPPDLRQSFDYLPAATPWRHAQIHAHVTLYVRSARECAAYAGVARCANACAHQRRDAACEAVPLRPCAMAEMRRGTCEEKKYARHVSLDAAAMHVLRASKYRARVTKEAEVRSRAPGARESAAA